VNIKVGKIYKLTNPMSRHMDFLHYLFIVSIDERDGYPRITFNDLKHIGDDRIIYEHNLKGYLLEEVS